MEFSTVVILKWRHYILNYELRIKKSLKIPKG